jgi:CheY-like chemotaxis protein
MSSPEESALEGVRVLLVDDDDDGRELVALILEQCGALVTTAGSASEAFAAFMADAPRLLISDIALPVEDGFSLLRRMRAVEATRGGHVVAVAISGYERGPDSTDARAGGFAAHLTKPVGRAHLLRALRAALASAPG